jgi:hypothetical protein
MNNCIFVVMYLLYRIRIIFISVERISYRSSEIINACMNGCIFAVMYFVVSNSNYLHICRTISYRSSEFINACMNNCILVECILLYQI